MTTPIQEKRSERPYFPYMLMICDQKSRMILVTELLQPLPDLKTMWEKAPAAGRVAPKKFVARDGFALTAAGILAKELGCKVKKLARLPAIGSARRELERFSF